MAEAGCAQEKGKRRLQRELGDQNISVLFLSPNRMPREEQRCNMLVKWLDIVRDYFSPNYDVASFLNHEQIIKITESSMKNVLLGNGVS